MPCKRLRAHHASRASLCDGQAARPKSPKEPIGESHCPKCRPGPCAECHYHAITADAARHRTARVHAKVTGGRGRTGCKCCDLACVPSGEVDQLGIVPKHIRILENCDSKNKCRPRFCEQPPLRRQEATRCAAARIHALTEYYAGPLKLSRAGSHMLRERPPPNEWPARCRARLGYSSLPVSSQYTRAGLDRPRQRKIPTAPQAAGCRLSETVGPRESTPVHRSGLTV